MKYTPGVIFSIRRKISWLLLFLMASCVVAHAQEAQESTGPMPASESTSETSTKNQWSFCKSMWREYQKGIEETCEWKRIVIQDVSLFGGFYAKGRVENDPAFPVHLIPNAEKTDAAVLKQEIKEGSAVDIVGTCVGMTQDGEVILEVEQVNLCR